MVLKGLRVGDTFEDGGRAYRVLSVNADGTYFSKAITPHFFFLKKTRACVFL